MKLRRVLKGDTLVEVMFAVGIFGAVAIGAISLMNKGVNTSQTTLETTMARQEVDAQTEALRFIHGAFVAESNGLSTGLSSAWRSITERAYTETTVQEEIEDFFTKETTGDLSCADLFSKRPVKAFALNAHNLHVNNTGALSGDILVTDNKLQQAATYPRMLYGLDEASAEDLSDNTIDENTGSIQSLSRDYLYAAEGIWVTNIASDAGGNDEDGVFQPDFYDFYIQTCWDQAGSGQASTISSIIRLYNPKRIVHDAQLDAYSYALIYNANGGAGAPPTQVDQNITTSSHDFTISTIRPIRSNFNFLGWSTSESATHANYQPGGTIHVDRRSTTLYAVWQRLYTYTLHYDVNASDASGAPASQVYGPTPDTNHTFAISTTQPTRPGYRFLGWSASKSSTSAQYAPGGDIKVTSESATLYAVWQRLYNHSLHYDANGGSGAPASQASGDVVTTSYNFTVSSAVPTRNNYRFLGWATSSSASSANIQGGDRINVSGSVTLYAVWKRVYTITLSYDANGGSGAPASDTFGPSDDSSHVFTISTTAPTRNKHTFLGWSTSSSATTASYSGGSTINLLTNTTLYAVWKRYYTFSLAYDANGGTGAPDTQNSGAQSSSSYSFTVSTTKPTRSGYDFLGWATSSSASSAEYQGGNSLSVTSEGTTTLYAVWRARYKFTLSYNANGGSGAPNSQDSGYVATSSHTFTISSTQPTRSGYVFAGWATASSANTASYAAGGTITVSANTTLYAVWTATHSFYLHLDANGGSGGPGTQAYGPTTDTSHTFTIPTDTPYHPKFNFLGWSTSPSALTATYTAGGTITVSANTTLYAVWTATHSFYLHLDANGGSGGPGTQAYGPTTDTSHTFTIPTDTPYHPKFNFLGWSTSPSALTATYTAGGTITISANTILFAVWSQTMQSWNRCSSLSTHEKITLRDARDGSSYQIIKMKDDKCWMRDNMAFDFSTNGDKITTSNTNYSSYNFITQANKKPEAYQYERYGYDAYMQWSYYHSTDIAYLKDYGRIFYNRFAGRNLCPAGWYLPDRDAFDDLLRAYDSYAYNYTATTEQMVSNLNFKTSDGYAWVPGSYSSGFRVYVSDTRATYLGGNNFLDFPGTTSMVNRGDSSGYDHFAGFHVRCVKN